MAAAPGEGPAASDAEIGPVDLAARVDEALRVQAAAFGLSQDEIDVRRHIVLRHLEHPHARALGAIAPDGRLVGFVYGLPNDRAQWWSTVVEPYLRATGSDGWLDDSFVITELHVHPDHQQRGIGRTLITAITDSVGHPGRSSRRSTRTARPAPCTAPSATAIWPARSSSRAPRSRTRSWARPCRCYERGPGPEWISASPHRPVNLGLTTLASRSSPWPRSSACPD